MVHVLSMSKHYFHYDPLLGDSSESDPLVSIYSPKVKVKSLLVILYCARIWGWEVVENTMIYLPDPPLEKACCASL